MALERKSRDRQSQQDSSPEHGQRLFNISRQSLQYLSWLFQSWPTDDRWRGSEIFKWCNRSQSTAPYSSPNVYVLAAPSHLTHSFMHTFSKHCPPTLDPAATRCEGLASGERSSCRPPPSSLITLRQQGGTHKTRSVLACQNEKKITISPPRLLYHQREKEIERQAAAEQQLKPPFRALFETPACSKFKQIHRDGSIHMTRTWGNKHL